MTDPTGGNEQVLISGTVTVLGGGAPLSTVSVSTGTISISNTVGVSGTVSLAGAGGGGPAATTQVASTGQIVWLAPTQTVSAAVSGTVSLLGASGGGPVATTQVASTGQIVWLAPTQTISAAVSGTVTVLTGTISISNTAIVFSTTQAAMLGNVVWLAPTQTVSAAVSGTITILAAPAISGTVTILTGTISNAGIIVTTTQVAVTGQLIWFAPTQTITATVTGTVSVLAAPAVSGTVSSLDMARTAVMIMVTTTQLAAVTTTVVQTVFVGLTQNTVGAAIWIVPANKTFRVLSAQAILNTSVTTATVTMVVLASTASQTNGPTSGQLANLGVIVPQTTQVQLLGLAQDCAAGATIEMGFRAGTICNLSSAIVIGYLFP